MSTPVRIVTTDELPLLQDIERAAGEVFRTLGMDRIADDDPLPVEHLATYQRAGRAWVIDEGGQPVAYLIAEPVDGDLHIAQVSVHPAAARRGLGRALIEHAAEVAATAGLAGLSLTTYTDVPWNGPYYRRLGFTELPEGELGPGLRTIREEERRAGLDRWPRAAMIRHRAADRERGTVHLRPADAPAIGRIWAAGWRDGHLGHVPDELVAARTPDSFQQRAAARVADTAVAVVDGEIAGFVMVVADEVEQVYVAAEHRGGSTAGALLAEAERLVAAGGHRGAWLAVVAGNTRARRFYARHGWRDEGPLDYPAAGPNGPISVPTHRYGKGVTGFSSD